MSKPNGRQKRAIENLAKALRPPPVENLAAALNECFGAAVEAGEQRTRPLTGGSERNTTHDLAPVRGFEGRAPADRRLTG